VLQALSLLINHMPPRTTRKSYRPRVSDRTMVGTLQPFCLFASEAEGHRYDSTMNLGKKENSQHLTPLHGLADKTNFSVPAGRRGDLSLDSPFYRTRKPDKWNRPRQMSGNPTTQELDTIEPPNYVPKTEAWFYRDAVIAFNSGKVLAALSADFPSSTGTHNRSLTYSFFGVNRP
jgi:hypothetical protein